MAVFEARLDSPPTPGAPRHLLLPPLRPPPRDPQEPQPDTRERPPRRRRWVIATAIALTLVCGVWLWSRHAAAPPGYVTAAVERGDVVRRATASGMVNPVETVQVGSYVSGRIEDLTCDYNSRVAKGQRCAKIDPRSYQAAVDQAAAAVATAKAQLNKDQANLDYLQRTYARNKDLAERGVASADTMDNAKNAYTQAQAQADLDAAMIRQREAELKTAQVNLDLTNIISPVDGTVVSRSVAIGQTVTASFQTPTLFLIAKDLKKMQVEANVSEAEIGEIREGEDASFTVEAFPGRTFTGEVTQIRQAPVAVQNVISYDVVIAADNHDLALKPGMTATAHIVTAQRHHVREIPQAALRFTPDGHAVEQAAAGESKHGQVWVR